MIHNPFKRGIAPTTQQLAEFCANPDLITYTCMALRVGYMGWMVQMEYTYFKPDTDANDQFFLSWMKWPDDMPMFWVVVSMPREYEAKATALLWQHGLKAIEGGVAAMITDKGVIQFPIHGDNVIAMENHSKGAGNVMYTNDEKKMEAARNHEKNVICEPFFVEHIKWLNTPEGRRAARLYWARHPDIQGEEPPYTGEPFDE